MKPLLTLAFSLVALAISGCSSRLQPELSPAPVEATPATVVGADGLTYILVRPEGPANRFGVRDTALWKCTSKPGLFTAGLGPKGQPPIFRLATQ